MKLGDDADEIDLDATLEKYDLTKGFLFRILSQLSSVSGANLSEILLEGGRDRLVLASGGVARDLLSIFRKSIDVLREKMAGRGNHSRGARIGAEVVNVAAGELGQFKEEDFSRDTDEDDQARLLKILSEINQFCVLTIKSNCFLVEKDLSDELTAAILELVDLKFLHRAKSRVTVPDRTGRLYDAYMLDISRYTGERARRNLAIVKFWSNNSDDALRRTALIFHEKWTVGNPPLIQSAR
jgi:hypothetical protein